MPANAETLFSLLHEARTKNQGHLLREEWLKIVQGFLDDACPERTEKNEAQRGPNTRTMAQSSDADWILYLESLPHLQGIDIKREIGKCQLWASTNNQKPTRRRIINWLNRCEKTVTFNGQGQSSFAPQRRENGQGIAEPKGWREAFPDCIYQTWAEVPLDSKRHILKQIR